MTQDADLIVVGAGPAGAVAALTAARLGRHALLLEARRFPRIKPCAGGVSPRARGLLRRLGLWDQVERVGYWIRGARLGTPRGRETTLVGAASALVVPRTVLDPLLARAAVAAGAELREATPVRGPLVEDGRVVGVRIAEGALRAPWVVAADGAHTRFSADPRPRRVLHACMAWFEGRFFEPGVLELLFDPALAPHYGWLFPESDTRANLGVCIEAGRRAGTPIRDLLARFLDRHYGRRLAGAVQLGDRRGHPIVPSVRVEHHAAPGVLLAGEACRLVNAATGEGISYALESGRLAAEALTEALRTGEAPETTAARYVAQLRRRLAAPYLVAELFRRRGMPLLEGVARLGAHPLFRRLAGQAPAVG
jgi:geranylgeranyl reductase family protein